jgi:hypothetical protein
LGSRFHTNAAEISTSDCLIDVLKDKAPEVWIFPFELGQSWQGVPMIYKNPRNRFTIAFADRAIVTLAIQLK